MSRANPVKWWCVVALAFVLAGLRAPAASAHIVHAGNAFADIGLSAHKDAIVYASRLGLIASGEGGDVFRPGDPLKRADLAHWAAAFDGLAKAEEAKTAGKAALDAGLVASLEGNATYGDINRAVFRNSLKLAGGEYPADREVTREQYAAFVVAFAATKVEGKRLEERAGLSAGPAGIVKARANSAAAYGYEFVIDGRVWTMSEHPRIVHAPGDPALWDGRELAASWLSTAAGGGAVLELLDFRGSAGEENAATSTVAGAGAGTAAGETSAAHAHHAASTQPQPQPENPSARLWTIVPVAVILVGGGAAILWSGRRNNNQS